MVKKEPCLERNHNVVESTLQQQGSTFTESKALSWRTEPGASPMYNVSRKW